MERHEFQKPMDETTIILRWAGKPQGRYAPLRITIPESWAMKPSSKLLRTWRKKHGGGLKLALLAEETPIPDDWPIAAVVELYGPELEVQDDTFDLANEAYRRGDYEVAVKEYTKVLNPRALANRAAALAMLGRDDEAANDCDAALAVEKTDKLLLRCARCRLRLGDVEKAEDRYNEVLKDGAASKGDLSEAAMAAVTEATQGSASARACSRDLSGAKHKLHKGIFHDDRQLLRDAFRLASSALATAPKSCVAATLAFRCLCGLKDWPKALAVYSDHDAITPVTSKTVDRHLASDILRAVGYSSSDNVAGGLIDDWMSRATGSSQAWLAEEHRRWDAVLGSKARGDKLVREQNYAPAVNAYREALKLDPSFPAVHANLGAALQGLHAYTEAAHACQLALDTQPLYPKARLRRARCLAALGASDAAFEYRAYLDDCRHTGTPPDPNARKELDALHKPPEAVPATDEDERSFFEQYQAYARRFNAKNRKKRQAHDEPDKKEQQNHGTLDSAFAVLGLPPSASLADLKRRYRDLVLKFHPDKSNDPNAEDIFRDIHDAYHSILESL